MTQAVKLREKLVNKLSDLFQLNQPDLDFGFYRIMHAKAAQVQQFIDQDLLTIISDAFGQADDNQVATARGKYEAAIQQAKDFGAPNPEETKPVQEAKAAYDAARESGSNEAQVYDHLFRFFERYYDSGDFISRRYYTRETAGSAAPYAIPYNGEEVKLHWANADQYYIKSTEYFSNFSFDLRQAKEVQAQDGLDFGHSTESRKVHFQIIDASEGEHGNIKAADNAKREFVLHTAQPVALNDANELIVNFEYRVLSSQDTLTKEQENQVKKEFGASNKGDLPNLYIASQILTDAKALESLPADYLTLLSTPAPTDKIKQRPLLAKYLNDYTSRNTMDYFIHKDLGSFLRRELDFYIKNEVMRLDDIENANAPTVESYLSKIKVLRQIGHKLIDFLAQLEDFQKKLWLKRKFVTEANYCITLDRVPEEFYSGIATNEAQLSEWIQLFAIDEIKGDLTTPAFSNPLTVEFLQSNTNLVLDTQFFDDAFKAQLLASIEDFDEQCDGTLVNSDNLQSAILLEERYKGIISGIYLDPPYNTDASEIIYKNGYKSSSWASLMYDRLVLLKKLLRADGAICVTIDDFEKDILSAQLDTIFSSENHLATAVIRSNPQGRSTVQGFSVNHEYGLFYKASSEFKSVGRLNRSDKQINRYNEIDEEGNRFLWENFRKTGTDSARTDRPKQYYPVFMMDKDCRVPELNWDDVNKIWILIEEPKDGEIIIYPVDEDGNERVWKWGHERVKANPSHMKVERGNGNRLQVYRRNYLNNEGTLPGTWWSKSKYGAGSHGTNLLTDMFGKGHSFPFPKSLYAVEDSLRVITNNDKNAYILDFFGGSGTTAHTVLAMNRADKGRRKYVMTEMGSHFDDVIIPRIKKAVYSSSWDAGKPKSPDKHLAGLKKMISDLQGDLEGLSGYQSQDDYLYERQKIIGDIENLEASIQVAQEHIVSGKNSLLGTSHVFKYIRLESYEDTLNNLRLASDPVRQRAIDANSPLKQDYMLNYMLDVETRGSQSLLNIDAFADPTAYTLEVKKPGTDESVERTIDLIETFNYLIGLRVEHTAAPQCFNASFSRVQDAHAPEGQTTRLVLDGRLQQDDNGPWWLRKIEGWLPADSANPNNGARDKVLIVWRKLTGDLEQDNLVLDEWFKAHRINSRDFEYATIYVNGSNNLPNLKKAEDRWKVRLIEEEFMQRMWDVEG